MQRDDSDTLDARLLGAVRERLEAARELAAADEALRVAQESKQRAMDRHRAAIERHEQIESDIARGVRPRPSTTDSKGST